jgi:uncharacterized membrane protein
MPAAVPPLRPQPEVDPGTEVARRELNDPTLGAAAPRRSRDVPEGDDIPETREIRRLLRQQVMLMRRNVHIGPLPPAKDFRAYEAVHPGSADRILKMAESELAHGQQMDREALAADKEIASRGQHYALLATLFLGALGAALGFAGHDWLGGTFVVSSLVPIVAHFLTRKAPEPKNQPGSDQTQLEQLPRPDSARDEPGSPGATERSGRGKKGSKTAKGSKGSRGVP